MVLASIIIVVLHVCPAVVVLAVIFHRLFCVDNGGLSGSCGLLLCILLIRNFILFFLLIIFFLGNYESLSGVFDLLLRCIFLFLFVEELEDGCSGHDFACILVRSVLCRFTFLLIRFLILLLILLLLLGRQSLCRAPKSFRVSLFPSYHGSRNRRLALLLCLCVCRFQSCIDHRLSMLTFTGTLLIEPVRDHIDTTTFGVLLISGLSWNLSR